MRTVGSYTLGPLLGRGGTGEVYAAEAPSGAPVALKLLRADLAFDEAMVAAFFDEAMRTREIVHPNVIRIIDAGADETTGCCFLVMERLDGESLQARLEREYSLPEEQLRPLAAAIADGMQAAHARGIVHRDLKPGNVMLVGERPTVIDFGVAKSLGAGSAVVTSRRVGTLAYMAPEQLAQGLITPAVDIWALGAILYEAATGRAPFDAFRGGRLPQLVETPPAPSTLAPVSGALSSLIMRCLEREPARRLPSMAEVARALRGQAERLTEDAGPIVRAAAPVTQTPAAWPARSRQWLAVTGAALAIGSLAAYAATRGDAPALAPVAEPAAAPAPPDAGRHAPTALPADPEIEMEPERVAPASPPAVTRRASSRPAKVRTKPPRTTRPTRTPTKPTTPTTPPTTTREGLD